MADRRQAARELILRALTDRKFRRLLETSPREAVSGASDRDVKLLLDSIRKIESQISGVGDNLLCLNGPCGIH